MKPALSGETLRLTFSHDVSEPAQTIERWLLALWQTSHKSTLRIYRRAAPISLELIGRGGAVSYQVRLRSRLLADTTRAVLTAHTPGLELDPIADEAVASLAGSAGRQATFALRRPGWVDLSAASRPDPVPALLTAAADSAIATAMQILLVPTWQSDEDGRLPAFWLAVRALALGSTQAATRRLGVIAGALGQLSGRNGLRTTSERRLDRRDVTAFLERRWPTRWFPSEPMATPEQVATLYHGPADVGASASVLGTTVLRTAVAPVEDGFVIGSGRGSDGRAVAVRVRPADLTRHAVVVGPSGSGKSVLLANLARGLTSEGQGVTVLDPHGQLVKDIARSMPEGAAQRAALLRFADTEHVIGLNPLRANATDASLVAEEVVEILQRVFGHSYWGPLMDLTLRHALIATAETGGSLSDTARLLDDPAFRESAVRRLPGDETARFFAQLEGKGGLDRRVLPAVHRLQRLLTVPWLRNVLSQPRSSLDFAAAMHDRRVLLMDLSGLGVANARLVGSLLLLMLRNAAFGRDAGGADARRHVVLIDEASWFASRTIGELLDGLRKFGVGLVMSFQRVGQLGSEDLRNAVFANSATTIAFRVPDHEDSSFLSRHFASELIRPVDLQRLPRYEAYAQLSRDGERLDPAWLRSRPPMLPGRDASILERRLIEQGRTWYTRPRRDVEAELVARQRVLDHDDEPEIRVFDEEIPANAA